jgi:hypothetical protein
MNTITLAIPCKSHVQARFNMCLLQSLNQIHAKTGYKPLVRFLIGKSNIVHARSILLTEWYENSKTDDLFLFLDSDQTFTIEDIETIIKKEGDVISGIYVNGAGYPTCYPMDSSAFQKGLDDRLLYSGCGFMLIRKPILHKMMPFLEKEFGAIRYAISRDEHAESYIIPFFQTKLLSKSELSPEATSGDWLGEDYSFCWRVREAGGILRGYMTRTLGHEIPQVSYLPDGYFPKQEKQKDPSIVYYCGNSRVKFCPKTKGLGGSEQAVVELSRAFASQGKSVTVYGNVYTGIYENVEYKAVEEFDITKEYETLILWRSFGAYILPLVKARTLLIDLHDIPRKEFFPLDILQEKRVTLCVKSKFHRSLLPHIPDSFFFIQPNGIQTSQIQKYKPVVSHREPLRFVWTSSYDRGLLAFLQEGWPRIRKAFPTALLHIYYGKELCPPEFQKEIGEAIDSLTGQVIDHGKVDIVETFKARWSSSYHIYITEFQEIDCLSIRESVVAGCIPIVANHAVFLERPAALVELDLKESVWDQMLGILMKLESDTSMKNLLSKALQKKLQESKLDIDWKDVAQEWSRVLIKQ